MRRSSDLPDLIPALLVSFGLFTVSLAALFIADEALDVSAIAGGIGIVISGALLGLVLLVARWRRTAAAYVTTRVVDEHADAAAHAGSDAPATFDDAAAV